MGRIVYQGSSAAVMARVEGVEGRAAKDRETMDRSSIDGIERSPRQH